MGPSDGRHHSGYVHFLRRYHEKRELERHSFSFRPQKWGPQEARPRSGGGDPDHQGYVGRGAEKGRTSIFCLRDWGREKNTSIWLGQTSKGEKSPPEKPRRSSLIEGDGIGKFRTTISLLGEGGVYRAGGKIRKMGMRGEGNSLSGGRWLVKGYG